MKSNEIIGNAFKSNFMSTNSSLIKTLNMNSIVNPITSGLQKSMINNDFWAKFSKGSLGSSSKLGLPVTTGAAGKLGLSDSLGKLRVRDSLGLHETSSILGKPLASNLILSKSYSNKVVLSKYLATIKHFTNSKILETNSVKSFHAGSISTSLLNSKYDQFNKLIQTRMSAYQKNYKNNHIFSTLPNGLLNKISTERIMSTAELYRNRDFRIPNLTQTILDETDTMYLSEGNNQLDEVLPETTSTSDINIDNEDIYQSVDAIAWVKMLLLSFEENNAEKLTAKIQIDGKPTNVSKFLHNSPLIIQNIAYICLLTYNFINGPVGTLMTLIGFLNWLLNLIH